MEPLISTRTLLGIIKTASPSSPLVRTGLAVLSLCAIAAVIRRAFGDPSEAVLAGVLMIAGVVVLTIVSFVAKKAPNPVLRHCAYAIAIVMTVLFSLTCAAIFSKYFFGWPPSAVQAQSAGTVQLLDESIRDRLIKTDRSLRDSIEAIDRFMAELDGMPWEEMPTRLQPLIRTLERNRDQTRVLVAGKLYRSTADEAVIDQQDPLVLVGQPELLKNNLHALIETRWSIAAPDYPKASALGSLASHLIAFKIAADAAPTFHTSARAGRGVVKGSEEYKWAMKSSMRESLLYTRKVLLDSWDAVTKNELVTPIVEPAPTV